MVAILSEITYTACTALNISYFIIKYFDTHVPKLFYMSVGLQWCFCFLSSINISYECKFQVLPIDLPYIFYLSIVDTPQGNSHISVDINLTENLFYEKRLPLTPDIFMYKLYFLSHTYLQIYTRFCEAYWPAIRKMIKRQQLMNAVVTRPVARWRRECLSYSLKKYY